VGCLVVAAPSGKALERSCLAGEGSAALAPWLQETLLAGDDEPALARLDIHDQQVQLVSGYQRPSAVLGLSRGVLLAPDSQQQQEEHRADDEGEQNTYDDGASDEAAAACCHP
jgi:hypothetical protein